MELLLKNAHALTMDEQRLEIKNAYLGIEGGKICYLSDKPPQKSALRELDLKGKVIMPGLINTHTHLPMVLLRGYADDYSLHEWLFEHVIPVEKRFDQRCFYSGAQLAIAESLRCGVTSVTDMYMGTEHVAKAALDSGIKINLSNGGAAGERDDFDFSKSKDGAHLKELISSFHGEDNGRIRVDGSIHAEYTSFDGFWRSVSEFAREHKLNMHLHLSETRGEHERCLKKYGKTPCRLFYDAGVFENRTTAAHCVFVTDEDMEIMARCGVTAAHNPVSNLKLASGVARVSDMLKKGINVTLGTDGACSNNSLDMFFELKLAAILQKGVLNDPTVLPAKKALEMATKNGAFAQGRERECGVLKPGYDADIIALDFEAPGLIPVHSLISSLCYSAKGGDVCMSMVRGKILYENGHFLSIDMERLKSEMRDYVMPHLFNA